MKPIKTFLLVTLFLLAAAAQARPEEIIRIGIISTTFGYAPVFVAREIGRAHV